jgi:UPF0042 nucleotide-binding protein
VFAVVCVTLGAAAGWANPIFRAPTSATALLTNESVAEASAAPVSVLATASVVARDPEVMDDGSADATPTDSSAPGEAEVVSAATPVAAPDAAVPPSATKTKASVRAASSQSPKKARVVATSVTAAAVAPSSRTRGTITVETFGYDFGPPPSRARFVADVRDIVAGPFTKSQTGLDASVSQQVLATSAAQAWLDVFRSSWMPKLKAGDMVAIGCAKGHHRSVALGAALAEELRTAGYSVNLVHRDILKSW